MYMYQSTFTVAWFRGAVHDVVWLGLDRPGTVSGQTGHGQWSRYASRRSRTASRRRICSRTASIWRGWRHESTARATICSDQQSQPTTGI